MRPRLQLALTAANRISHEILEGLSANDLRGACGNAVVAHPAGILQGVDQQFTGRVERVDVALLRSLLDNDIIPVVPPLGCDGEGSTYRLNSDAVAVEVARALGAVKLIYLTSAVGVAFKLAEGETEPSLIRQIRVEDAEELLKKRRAELEENSVSKLANAVKATRGGVPRVHIIDGRVEEGLLAEVFSNEGIGTLVHANEYQAIRRALKKDARGHLSPDSGRRRKRRTAAAHRGRDRTADRRLLRLRRGRQPGRLRGPAPSCHGKRWPRWPACASPTSTRTTASAFA